MKLSLLIIAVLGFLVIMDLEELGAMAKKKDKCGPKKKGGMAKRGGKGKGKKPAKKKGGGGCGCGGGGGATKCCCKPAGGGCGGGCGSGETTSAPPMMMIMMTTPGGESSDETDLPITLPTMTTPPPPMMMNTMGSEMTTGGGDGMTGEGGEEMMMTMMEGGAATEGTASTCPPVGETTPAGGEGGTGAPSGPMTSGGAVTTGGTPPGAVTTGAVNTGAAVTTAPATMMNNPTAPGGMTMTGAGGMMTTTPGAGGNTTTPTPPAGNGTNTSLVFRDPVQRVKLHKLPTPTFPLRKETVVRKVLHKPAPINSNKPVWRRPAPAATISRPISHARRPAARLFKDAPAGPLADYLTALGGNNGDLIVYYEVDEPAQDAGPTLVRKTPVVPKFTPKTTAKPKPKTTQKPTPKMTKKPKPTPKPTSKPQPKPKEAVATIQIPSIADVNAGEPLNGGQIVYVEEGGEGRLEDPKVLEKLFGKKMASGAKLVMAESESQGITTTNTPKTDLSDMASDATLQRAAPAVDSGSTSTSASTAKKEAFPMVGDPVSDAISGAFIALEQSPSTSTSSTTTKEQPIENQLNGVFKLLSATDLGAEKVSGHSPGTEWTNPLVAEAVAKMDALNKRQSPDGKKKKEEEKKVDLLKDLGKAKVDEQVKKEEQNKTEETKKEAAGGTDKPAASKGAVSGGTSQKSEAKAGAAKEEPKFGFVGGSGSKAADKEREAKFGSGRLVTELPKP
jgi:hypothetical protein